MTREDIISGLKFTIEMFLLDPNTGETFTEPKNDMDKTTIDACKGAIELLEQEPILEKINKMKSEIADSLEFWDYSPNNNPLARDMLETLTNFWGDMREVKNE